ncbi:MAG: efflux RND transporter periplasmic adaptor subunit [Myxococcota bacterium]|nr:efflux RND transporter periplasmic adaptor subunit [Myxococcota bacterium]
MRTWQARRVWLAALAIPLAAGPGCDDGTVELELVGTVERTLVELVAPAAETIVAVHRQRGDRVAADEPIVQLDTTYASAEVARAEAGLAGARTGEAVAKHELERARKLRRDRVASEQALDRARLAYDEARARLREAEALLTAAQKRIADLTLSAPAPGVVDQLPFEAGERVAAGAVVGVVLADGAPWVRVWVPEGAYVRVLPGTPAEIRIDGFDEALRGSVLDVAREPEFTPHYALTERDRVHLVYEARVRIEEAPDALRPGVPAEVRILAPDAVLTAKP